MFLSDLSISKPVAMVMVTVALLVFGFIAYQKLGLEENPEIDLPFLGISIVYPGADPATVESEVTDIIEDEVATISGIKELTSTSSENLSFIFIEFELETDIDVAAQDVRDKMDGIQRRLPDDCEKPVVQKFDPGAESIMDIAVGGDVRPQDLAEWVDDYVKPRIESIDGVGSVDIAGLRDREVRIWLDSDRMASYGVSVQEVIGTIQTGHMEIPGGRIETGDREFLVITSGELESVDAFNDLIVGTRNGVLIRLSDVAVVEDGLEDQRSLARLNGKNAVSLSVIKKSGANTVAVADSINEIINELKAEAPPGIEISIPRDNSIFTRDSFEQVQEHLYGGGLMAILIVLLFLGNIRTTIIAAISIPTSIITTYIFINAFGFTLNNVTMLALTLMVGMLIDDAIVVLENIYRHTEMGKTPLQAAKEGAKEIGFAVLSTTLTILAVFIPVANMTGIIGRFMYQYGITVAVGASVSYLVAITLGPMLASRFMQYGTSKFILFRWFDAGFSRFENGYKWLIGAALRRKGITILLAFIAMIGALFLFGMTKKEFFADMDFNETGIIVEMPEGTSLAALSEFTEPLEEIVSEIPEVENMLTTLGSGMYGNQNEGFIFIDLVEKTDRDRSVWEIEDELRKKIEGTPGAKLLVGGGSHFGTAYDYAFSLTGTDMDELEELADRFIELMSQEPMFRELDTSSKKGKPEVRINIDRDRAADLGIDIATIGITLNLLVSGENAVADYMESGRQSEVKVRLESPYRDRPDDLLSLIIYNRDDDPIEVSSFASVEISSGASEIEHMDKMRSISVYANINEGYSLGEAVQWSNEKFETMLPPGVRARVSGEADIMAESFESMTVALILAIMLIYVVLAAQFNHFIHPLTIMISLPLSFIGAFGLLFLTGMTVNMFSLIGIIMLMGLVTKNAILVVEFANQLRERGMERDEAMMTAGPIRLRPVLMTALSTIGGMLPVAMMMGGGAGVEMRAPMAVAVIGGLAASTLLTLVVVPVVYSLFDQATDWILRVLRITKPSDATIVDIPDDQI